MYSASAFAEALQRYRRVRGFTQAELVGQAHISARAVSDLERGLKHPQRATVRLLTEALALLPEEARDFEAIARSRPANDGATSVRTSGRPQGNLPIQHRRLIGRARDIAGICQALRDESSLVTVVGPGGVGKTCLAVEMANKLQADYVDGVWFVDLSSVTEAELVAPTIATSLGIRAELDSGPRSNAFELPGAASAITRTGQLRARRRALR